MSEPVRVQLSRKKGWRMPENTVSVAMPGFWGNSYSVVLDEVRYSGEDDESGEPIMMGPWLCQFAGPQLAGIWFPTKAEATQRAVDLYRFRLERILGSQQYRERLPELCGKNLACWCPLGSPCHADVLLELANPLLAEIDRLNQEVLGYE